MSSSVAGHKGTEKLIGLWIMSGLLLTEGTHRRRPAAADRLYVTQKELNRYGTLMRTLPRTFTTEMRVSMPLDC